MIRHRAPRISHRRTWPALLALAAWLPAFAMAQGTAVVEAPNTSTPAKTQKVADLTGRYRFSEKYTTDDEHTGPGVVGSYRVASVEVIKDSFDSPQGAPKRVESTRQLIYSERPIEMGSPAAVVSVSRNFERYRAKPEDPARTMGARPLDGLSALVRPKIGDFPFVLGLTEGRSITEYEFDAIAHQVFVPQLASLLPTQIVRVGDVWRVSRRGMQAMLGDPFIQGDTLVGKLSEIRKEVDGPRMVASITITGKLSGPAGETSVNAEVLFTFFPESSLKDFPETKKPTFPPRPKEDLIESRGAITELRLARVITGPLPGTGRLRFQSNRELTLHRQLGLAAGAAGPPKLDKVPESTEANSWVAHIEPSGRYAFRHPQDLIPPDPSQPSPKPNTSFLLRTRREGRDTLQVEYVGKVLTPEDLKKELREKWNLLKMEVMKGSEEWLPEAEWPKMRVHRIEGALKVADPKAGAQANGTRIHFDGYLILFGQSASIMAISATSRDAASPFRKEVEQILKSIQLDPARPVVN